MYTIHSHNERQLFKAVFKKHGLIVSKYNNRSNETLVCDAPVDEQERAWREYALLKVDMLAQFDAITAKMVEELN
jgi:hypothetical protein